MNVNLQCLAFLFVLAWVFRRMEAPLLGTASVGRSVRPSVGWSVRPYTVLDCFVIVSFFTMGLDARGFDI
jgi:hypothetical protein